MLLNMFISYFPAQLLQCKQSNVFLLENPLSPLSISVYRLLICKSFLKADTHLIINQLTD